MSPVKMVVGEVTAEQVSHKRFHHRLQKYTMDGFLSIPLIIRRQQLKLREKG